MTPFQRLNHFTRGHDIRVQFSAKGQLIAIANGNPARIASQNDGRPAAGWKATADLFDHVANKLAHSLELITPAEQKALNELPRQLFVEVTAFAFSPTDDLIAVGTSVGQVKLFNTKTGSHVKTLDDQKARRLPWRTIQYGLDEDEGNQRKQTQDMLYNDDAQLEQSCVVANCRMNRERELSGSNGYEVEIGFQPLTFLKDRLRTSQTARWLDLCCGTGRALVQASTIIDREAFPLEIVGIDLAGMFARNPSEKLALIKASLSTWTPSGSFDLITCVHGLHYIGDKLGLITRACSWLNREGLLVANLDMVNLRLSPGGLPSHVFAKELRRAGVEYSSTKRRLECVGHRTLTLPFRYVGADDEAGPNSTRQPAVHSFYEQ